MFDNKSFSRCVFSLGNEAGCFLVLGRSSSESDDEEDEDEECSLAKKRRPKTDEGNGVALQIYEYSQCAEMRGTLNHRPA